MKYTYLMLKKNKAELFYTTQNLMNQDIPIKMGERREIQPEMNKLDKEKDQVTIYELKDVKETRDSLEMKFKLILRQLPQPKDPKNVE